jgi:hypothetical protein
MPEDELRWIEKYRAALNQRTAKPRGLLEAIARALGLAVGRIIARTQRTAKVYAQVPQPESSKLASITQGESRSTDKPLRSDEHNVA